MTSGGAVVTCVDDRLGSCACSDIPQMTKCEERYSAGRLVADMAGVELVPLEPRPFRPFRTSEEYLYAMKEDLAEWLHALYGMDIDVESFMERLDTGVILCRHANNVMRTARERGLKVGAERDVVFRPEVQPGTFHARDNVSNFISWCRGALSIKECLLFETDDLVLRKNERSFILCLLEVARKGAQLGMLAPLLVQMEQEIEAEMAQDQQQNGRQHHASAASSTGIESDGHEADDDSDTQYEPPAQIITNDLRSLHERVVELLNRCSCPSQFPMIRVADGKYRIGDTQILIFVRILRNHVMVRVGGGWDTLEHYLDKHDPCRCRLGHRFSSTARLSVVPGSNGSLNMQVTYNRPRSSGTPSSSRSSSVPTSPPSRRRSFDLTRFSYGEESRDHVARGPSRNSHCSDDSSSCASNASLHILNGDSIQNVTSSPCRTKVGHPSSADSSSEISEGEGKASLRMGRQRKYSPRKIMRIGENSCDSEDSLLSSLSPPTSLDFQQQVSSSAVVTENSQKPVKIVSASPCNSDGSNSTCHDDNGLSVRKSKIPKSKSPCKRMNYRCYSSEDLSSFKLSASRSEACLITHHSKDFSKCIPPVLKGRRASTSGSSGIIYGRGSLPRSSSTYHEKGDQGFSVRRSDPLRTPLKSLPNDMNRTKAEPVCRTWSGRPRSSRSSASPDIFRSSSSTRTPPKSPAKNTSDQLPKKQSPVKPVPPLLEEILNDDLLDSDEKILEKMERLINEYRTREDRSQKSQDDDSTLCSASTDECSGADDGFPSPSRAKNRRKSLNGSPSKIPVYTWQRRD